MAWLRPGRYRRPVTRGQLPRPYPQYTGYAEPYELQLRAEVFNLFSRVQFGYPATIMGISTFGVVSSQSNTPRLVQVEARLSF